MSLLQNIFLPFHLIPWLSYNSRGFEQCSVTMEGRNYPEIYKFWKKKMSNFSQDSPSLIQVCAKI